MDADLHSSVGANFGSDVAGVLIDNIAQKVCVDRLPTRMLPTSGDAPADNTNTSITDLR